MSVSDDGLFDDVGCLIAFLEHHNAWRRGADIDMKPPKQIGMALDRAIEILKTLQNEGIDERIL